MKIKDLNERLKEERTLYEQTKEEHPITATPKIPMEELLDKCHNENKKLYEFCEKHFTWNDLDGVLDGLYGMKLLGITSFTNQELERFIDLIEKDCEII